MFGGYFYLTVLNMVILPPEIIGANTPLNYYDYVGLLSVNIIATLGPALISNSNDIVECLACLQDWASA